MLGNGSVNKFPLKRTRATIEELRFLWTASHVVATQRCGKHMSAAVNQHATIEEPVFSMGSPRVYNEDLRQLREFS
jgi:hypothetical protein